MLMDGQIECMRGDLLGMQVPLNTTSRDEHVGDVERFILTVKERMRCTYTTLPFKQIPSRMIIGLFWLNAFPALDGISATLSPRTYSYWTDTKS